MPVPLEFDIEKTIAAVAFLIEHEGGELDMFLGLKMLYLADKEALISWGTTITGDSFVSMPKGPVLSEVYDLFKGTGNKKLQAEWDSVFSEKVNHCVRLLKDVDIDVLSEREMELLETARKEINSFAPWEVARWLHDTCPEWEDPNGSSLPIQPDTILRNAGRTDEEIQVFAESNRLHTQTKILLGIR
ncbi:MAG TPA: Panacea domain-containing protein [Terriglobia bacterium]|nr:Panacea domain-containing protein [Terriglobia bacterium]